MWPGDVSSLAQCFLGLQRFCPPDGLVDPNARISHWLSIPFVTIVISAVALGWKPLLQVWLMLCYPGFQEAPFPASTSCLI